MEKKSPPRAKLRVIGKEDGEVANVETDLYSWENDPLNREFAGILEALAAYFKEHPEDKKMSIEIIGGR